MKIGPVLKNLQIFDQKMQWWDPSLKKIFLKPFKHYQDALFSLFPTIYNEALSLNYPICDLQGCLKRKPNLILAQYGIMAKHFLAAYGHMAARIFHVYCTMYNVVVLHYQAILKCILSREPPPPCVCASRASVSGSRPT